MYAPKMYARMRRPLLLRSVIGDIADREALCRAAGPPEPCRLDLRVLDYPRAALRAGGGPSGVARHGHAAGLAMAAAPSRRLRTGYFCLTKSSLLACSNTSTE